MSDLCRRVLALMLLLTIFMSSSVSAQCATGVDTGGACIPPDASGMPGYNSGNETARPSPAPIWKDSWGAIAIDGESGKAGTVTDRNSKSDAASDAIRECKGRGGVDCQVELTYYNQCAAVAWGVQGRGLASGAEQADAERGALRECKQAAKDGCKVVYSACSRARRIQ